MNIKILQLIEGARQAKGLTVVIDVFRAFSTACYLFDQGAKEIIPVKDIDVALKLKAKNPDIILIGERNERKPKGFDYGNSPSLIKNIDFTGKTIVHSTSSGTQGLINAVNADEILTGSFVNAPAIARYIKMKKPENVSLVCMGYATLYPTEEDTFCAEYIRNSLTGVSNNMIEISKIIKRRSGKRLFDPKNQAHSPEEDFYLCLDTGRFDFVLRVKNFKDGLIRLDKFNC